MGTTPRGLRYPPYTQSPDIPGDIYNLASDVNSEFDDYDGYVADRIADSANSLQTNIDNLANRFQSGDWSPQLGGPSVSLGSGGSAEGTFMRLDDAVTIVGTLVFGSGGSFGSGGAVVQNLPFNLRTSTMAGTGYINNGGSTPAALSLAPASTSTAYLLLVRDGYTQYMYQIGSPVNGGRISFTISGHRV